MTDEAEKLGNQIVDDYILHARIMPETKARIQAWIGSQE